MSLQRKLLAFYKSIWPAYPLFAIVITLNVVYLQTKNESAQWVAVILGIVGCFYILYKLGKVEKEAKP